MGIVLNPNTDLDALTQEVMSYPVPEPVQATDSLKEMYDAGAARQEAIDRHNEMLEERGGSFIQGVTGSVRFNTMFGTGAEHILDSRQAGPEDEAFNAKTHIKENGSLPGLNSEEYEYLLKAKNKKHFGLLLENLRDKRDFMLNAEALGTPLAVTSGLVAEGFNFVNYVPVMNAFGLKRIKTVADAFKAGAVTGVMNAAEELAIDQVYEDRDFTDYSMAFTFGAGLGTGLSLLGKSSDITAMRDTQDTIETLDRVTNKLSTEAKQAKVDAKINGPAPVREYTVAAEKDVMAALERDPEVYSTMVKLDENGKVLPERLSTEAEVHLAADKYDAEGKIDQEGSVFTTFLGIETMSHSLARSKNKLARYISNVFLEHPEKTGFKSQTAALRVDQLEDSILAPYAKRKVELHAAWAKEAEKVGYKHTDFNRAATLWIDGGEFKKLPNSTDEMNKILDDFMEVYKDTNGKINKVAQEAGVEEFQNVDLDQAHLYRSYNLDKFHELTTKYGDNGEAIKRTLTEAIRRGNFKEFSDKVKDPDVEIDTEGLYRKMAEAIYNRMLKRSTVNTADANLLSSGNQRLLKDAIEDADMSDFDKAHILHVLETQGRDLKANPMAKQIRMDLSTQVGDVSMMDLLDTNLDNSFRAKGRYWLGRAAMAEKGDHFASERSIREAIDAVDKHSTKSGQTPDEIRKDKQRLEAGVKMILGQPIDPSEMGKGWQGALRYVRKAVGASGLGKLGLVQFGESGRAIAAKGVKTSMFFPEVARLMKDITTGKVDDAMLKDIEDFAVGQLDARLYLNHPDFRADDYGMKISGSEKALDKMSFFMSKASGWNRVHRMQTAYVMQGLSQKWYRDIMSGNFKKTQMNDLGVDAVDLAKIKEQMKKHAEPAEGLHPNTKAKTLNLSQWEPDVRKKFALMLQRKSKNAVQDIMAGETPMWMNSTIGKFLGQFRSFSVAALGKQTIRDFKMLKQGDMESALALQFMLATSTMATMTKIYWNSMTMSPAERKKYLDEQLSMPQLAASVMTYTGSLSGLIDIGTTASTTLFGVNLAGQRQYRADGISGLVPGVQFVDRTLRATAGVVQAPFDGYTQADARALMSIAPLNTLWGLDVLTKMGIQQFPE